MLNKIRNDVAHNKVVRAFLIIITLAFVFWGMGISNLSLTKNYAIKVGSVEVSASDYFRAYQQAKMQISQQFQGQEIPDELFKAFGVKKRVTDDFINQSVFEEYANLEDIYISNETVFNLIKQQPGFHDENGVFDKQVYKARLRDAQMNPIEFEKSVKRNLKANLVSNIFTNLASVSDIELDMQIKYNQERRDIDVLTITPTDLAKLPTATEEELEALYNENIESFKIPEERSFKLLVVSKDALAKEQKVTAEEIKQYYEDNKSEFFTKPEFKVQQILVKEEATANKILAIADLEANFNKYVQEHSTDKSSKAKNGDMGWLTADIFGADFENAMNSTTAGKVAPKAIKSVFGFHIFKITEVKDAKQKSFAEVKEKVKADLISTKAESALYEKTTATQDMVAAGEKLDNIAEQLGFKLKSYNNVKADGPQSYIKDVFSTENGEVSQQFDLALNSIGFVEVTDVKEESVKTLTEVKDTLVAKFNAAKTAELLQIKADEVLDAIKENNLTFKAAVKQFKLSAPIKSIVSIARSANQKKQVSDEIASKAFATSTNTLIESTTNDANNIVIIKVLDSDQEKISDESKEQMRKALISEKTNDLFAAFSAQIKTKSGVEVNQKVIDYIIKQN